MTPDQVRVALAGFRYTAPQHCETDAQWEETSEMCDRYYTYISKQYQPKRVIGNRS
jgi:hypothetical protein